MKGQFFSSAFIASFILLTSAVSAILVYKNAKMKFSFQIISLIALSSIGTLVFHSVWRKGHQNYFQVMMFGIAIYAMQLFVPISIIFTQRQWKLLQRYQIRNCNSVERLRALTKELNIMKWGFKILLYSAMVCMAGYAILTSIFSHYAIHVEPCNESYYECPELVTMIYLIRFLQVCLYLAYSICAALMCLFAYKMHKTIKETYENWEMSCFEIFLHCFALVFPVCVLTAILCTGKGNMLEQDSE